MITSGPYRLLVMVIVLILTSHITGLPVNADYYWGSSVNTVNIGRLEGTNSRRLILNDAQEYGIAWGGQVSSLRVQYSVESIKSSIKTYRTASTDYSPDGTFTSKRVLLEFFGYESMPGTKALNLSPFWGFGVGLSRFSINNFRIPGEISIDSSDENVTAQIMVGLDYRFSSRQRVNLQYRYLMTDNLGYEDTRNNTNYEFGNYSESAIGLQYRWFY